ncbi:hypothetical protein MJL22_26385, partial [Salmonella enterica subsp. enterica serovar Montevideo]|nr:hypothetical protein [Salmonella enterica subsp. enterica serovar Montevideo]
WLPVNWVNEKGGLHTVADSATLSRPLYAIWLQNSDKYSLICDRRTIDVLVRRLRHKITPELLVTQHGEGYFLASEVY